MNTRRIINASLLALAVVAAARVSALEITLPEEKARFVESPLPGYTLAVALCGTCHSADYVPTQPTSTRAYWQAAVTKMQKTFGAPIPDQAVEPIVDYLVKTYGTERNSSATTQPGSADPARSATPAKK